MNGMIFAAGLGTRLAPLTDTRPKALVELCGRPMLAHALDHLTAGGVDHIVVNVHHFADQIIEYIAKNKSQWRAEIVISDEREQLLDTGGGLIKALPLMEGDGPIVIGNADVITDSPIAELIEAHVRNGWDATLLTSPRASTRHLLFGGDNLLCGWEDVKNGKSRTARETAPVWREAFNGFHVIEQRLVRAFGEERPLPIISAYLDLAGEYRIGRERIKDERYWYDVGTVEKLRMADDGVREHEKR